MIIVLDFGGQYNQLIARRVRECNVYCEVHPYTLPLEKIKEMNPKGIIFTGGPNSVYKEESPRCSKEIFDLGIPVLGICYGAQLMSYLLGGEVATAPVSEYGKTEVEVDTTSKLYGEGIVHIELEEEDHMLDEPYRLYFQDAGRFPCDSPYSGLPDCRYGK